MYITDVSRTIITREIAFHIADELGIKATAQVRIVGDRLPTRQATFPQVDAFSTADYNKIGPSSTIDMNTETAERKRFGTSYGEIVDAVYFPIANIVYLRIIQPRDPYTFDAPRPRAAQQITPSVWFINLSDVDNIEKRTAYQARLWKHIAKKFKR